ncbi:hypothetical protein EYF80_008773 [Liparis tanakae]|uniref:Uncharacterized protein n=1 Tax=Liparis tanakae TaxID=230148 RepID=A0A4Z2ITP6_9TELE|nr:hypothetical protein EYF80_008773 [Liparis tanakae]
MTEPMNRQQQEQLDGPIPSQPGALNPGLFAPRGEAGDGSRKVHHGNLVCGRHGGRFFALGEAGVHRLRLHGGFPCTGSESLSNIVKGPSSGLGHFQEGEDEEQDEEDHEDDEDVRTTQFLKEEEREESIRKVSPTRKLAVQLEKPETAMAAGRGPWEKSSATMNQGIGPGPISKLATKPNTATMARRNITHHQRQGDSHDEGKHSHSTQTNQVQRPPARPLNQEELGVDARQLLRELEDYGDDDGLTVVWGAEEFEDGHFLLRGHLHPFFLHLLNIIAHVLTATQTHQRYREKKGRMNGEQAGTLLCKKDGRTSCNGLGTSCGQTLDDEQVARAFRAEGQQDALQDGRQDGESQQQRPQSVRAQKKLQTKDLKNNR